MVTQRRSQPRRVSSLAWNFPAVSELLTGYAGDPVVFTDRESALAYYRAHESFFAGIVADGVNPWCVAYFDGAAADDRMTESVWADASVRLSDLWEAA